jgi:hypothetical protein
MSGFLVGVVVAAITVMIGIQSALRSRWLRDEQQAAQLLSLLPNPAPSSIFVPVSTLDRATTTGDERFDRYFFGPLQRPWSAPFYIRRAFRRPGFTSAWAPQDWSPIVGASARGLLYDDSRMHPFERLRGDFEMVDETRQVLPWPRLVPFVITDDGRVMLVGSFFSHNPDGTETKFEVPQTAASASADIRFEPDGIRVRPR